MSKTHIGENQIQAINNPAAFQDPYGLYETFHSACPVHNEPGVGFLVARYEEARAVTLSARRYSSIIAGDDGPRHMGINADPLSDEVTELLTRYHDMDNALFAADPPQHTAHRTLANKALNPRRVHQLEGSMREIAHQLVDDFINDHACELHSQFSIGLPLTVIADTLGVDREDMPKFKFWSDCMIAGNLDVLDNKQRAMVAHAVIDFQKYFIPRIEQRRQEPTDDLLSGLANATIEDDDISEEINRPRQLTVAEILPIISQILLAGNETTTNLIGNGLVALIERPALMAEIRSDHSLIPDFVEEVLRFESPVQCIYRRANEDVEIDGVKIPAGSMVVPALGAANQDPDVFPRPRELNIHRPNLRRHLAFGIGPHFCVGAEMARLEARVAFETLLGRLDNIRLSEGAELRIHPTFSTRGFKEIPIEFDAIV